MGEFEDVGGLCPNCGYGYMLHDDGGACPEPGDVGPADCPYCGSEAAYQAARTTSPTTWLEFWRCQGDCGRMFKIARSKGDGFWGRGDEEDAAPVIDMEGLNARDRGRLEKALERPYNFGGSVGVTSLRTWLETRTLTNKSKRVREYARRKRRGCYPKLKRPVTEYTVWVGDGDTGVQVPKMVWDALNVPKRKG